MTKKDIEVVEDVLKFYWKVFGVTMWLYENFMKRQRKLYEMIRGLSVDLD